MRFSFLGIFPFLIFLLIILTSCGKQIKPLPQRPIYSQDINLVDMQRDYKWPPKEWWHKYKNSDLDSLIKFALVNSPSIEIAHSRFVTAAAHIMQVTPSNNLDIDLVTSFKGNYNSKNGVSPFFMSGKWFRSYSTGLSISYQLDLWGKNKAMINSSISLANAQSANLQNAQLIITTAIVQNYFVMQLNFVSLSLLKQQLSLQREILNSYMQKLKYGIIPNNMVIETKNVINNLKNQIYATESNITLQKNILIALVGGQEKFILNLKKRPLPSITINAPKTLNYNLLSRRADLQMQRWLVESSMNDVTVAKASFYPSIDLTAFAGFDAIKLNKLLELPSKQYSIVPSLILPIFHTGILKANLLYTQAKHNEAISNYNQAIVNTIKDVYIAVNNLNTVNQQIYLAQNNLYLSKQLLNNNYSKLNYGLNTNIDVLSSKIDTIFKQNELITLVYQRIISDVDLIKALGGGYIP